MPRLAKHTTPLDDRKRFKIYRWLDEQSRKGNLDNQSYEEISDMMFNAINIRVHSKSLSRYRKALDAPWKQRRPASITKIPKAKLEEQVKDLENRVRYLEDFMLKVMEGELPGNS